MKIKLIVLSAVGFLFILFFTNCKKSITSQTTQPTKVVSLSKIDADLNAINAKYKSVHTADKTTLSTRGALIVTTDLFAAWETSKFVGEWCLTGWGTVAALGVTVLAAGLSSAACYDGAHIDSTTRNNQINEVIANVDKYSIANPYDNPYDSIGKQHNELVKLIFQHGSVSLNHTTLMYHSTDLTDAQLTDISMDTAYFAYNMLYYLSQNNPEEIGSIDSFLNYGFGQNGTVNDSVMLNISEEFNEGFSSISSTDEAIAFINDYENYFINTETNLTESEKRALLIGFSVGKYSSAMWYDALSVN